MQVRVNDGSIELLVDLVMNNKELFAPLAADGGYQLVGGDRWVMVGDGDAVNVDLFLTDKDDVFDVDDESDDDDFTRDLPLNMSDDEVKGLLFAYQAEGLEYDDWLKVGQALHHQYLGSDVGLICGCHGRH